MTSTLALDAIRLDGGTQPRATLDHSVVQHYADAMREGGLFPPVTVYYDGHSYWLADGFHRYYAAQHVGHSAIDADVRQGSRRTAVLHAVGANAAHGLRRTNADKRRAVYTLFQDAEWANWSDNKIGQLCKVDRKSVAKYRAEYLGNSQDSATRAVERAGHVYVMDIAHIGGSTALTTLEEAERQMRGALARLEDNDTVLGTMRRDVASIVTPEQYRMWLGDLFVTDGLNLFILQFMAGEGLPNATAILADLTS
jgi:ParB-like nuclease domain